MKTVAPCLPPFKTGRTIAFKPVLSTLLTTALALTLLFAACDNPTTPEDDTTPPANVTGLAATRGDARVTLDWTDPADSDLASIEITFSPAAGSGTQPITVAKSLRSWTVTGLANGTEYTFTVKATDTSGNKSNGVTATATPATDTTPPAKVTNLDAEPGNGQAILTWTDPPNDDLASIEITFSPATGSGTQPLSVLKGAQRKTVTGLANGTEYTFTVKAVDTSDNKSPGETKTATPEDKDPPATVTALVAEPGNAQAILTWTDPADDDLVFIEITFSPNGTQPISVAKGIQRQTVTGLANGTEYTFTIKAVDAAGNKSGGIDAPTTPDASISNDTDPPATVTGLTAKSENGQATLAWTNPANSDLDFVEITFSPAVGNIAQPLIVRGAQSQTVTGLANGTEYTFTLKAVDDSGNKSAAATVKATPAVDITPPAKATGLAAASGNGEATLTWTDPADSDLASIEITFSPAAGSVTQPISVAKGAKSKIITGLANGTKYTFTVKAVDATGNKSEGATATATPAAPSVGDKTVAQLITEGSALLVAKSYDSAVQSYENAYAKNNNDPAAIVYSSIAKLASIAKDQKVQNLLKNRFGLKSYPGTLDSLLSDSWLEEYDEEEFIRWYYDEQGDYWVDWYGKHPATGVFFGSSGSSGFGGSSLEWVLDTSEYDGPAGQGHGPGYYRQDFVGTTWVWDNDQPYYAIDGYYDSELGYWVEWYDNPPGGGQPGYYYYYYDVLTFVSSERQYSNTMAQSYYDGDRHVSLQWYEAGSFPYNSVVPIAKTGYHYYRHEQKLTFITNTPRYEVRGSILFPALETPQWVKDNGAYTASLNSGNIPGAATMQLLLFSNLIDKNTNGLNDLLDQTLDAVFGANFEEVATRVAKLNYTQSVPLSETIVTEFGLTEIFEGDVVITKVEMDLLVASLRLVKAALEWLNAYNWNTDLNFLKVNWVNDEDVGSDLLTKIKNTPLANLPLKNNFLKDRNNGKMAASKADFIKAIDAAIGAYDNIDKEQLIPQGVKDEIAKRQWIKAGLTTLKNAINGGQTFWIPDRSPDGNGWNYSAANGFIGVNLGRLFTPGYVSLDKLIVNTGGIPDLYGFSKDASEPARVSAKADIAKYEYFGFKFKTGPLYGASGVVEKIEGQTVQTEYVEALFPRDIAEAIWDAYHK